MGKIWSHFKTITHHKFLVMQGCFRVGLYLQGICHDLSKYSPSEFWLSAKYYQGYRSPLNAEREDTGVSTVWLHHKGRNKHHYEYWTDLNIRTKRYEPVPMPRNYFTEMVMDRIAACKTYNGGAYTEADPLNYFINSTESRDTSMMHPQTKRELLFLLTMLRDKGEKETFRFIREVVLRGLPFAEE